MDNVLLFAAGLATGLALCWLRINLAFPGQQAEDYNSSPISLDLRKHLSGPLTCEGVIFGPFGRVTSRFVAEFEGNWDGNEGELQEKFVYDSGETQERVWSLKMGERGQIEATAPDVVGTGKGLQAGSAFGMTYRLRLPKESGGYVLDATDWMYLLENGTIMNRSQFRKFGITVAELVATIRRADNRQIDGLPGAERAKKQQDVRTAA